MKLTKQSLITECELNEANVKNEIIFELNAQINELKRKMFEMGQLLGVYDEKFRVLDTRAMKIDEDLRNLKLFESFAKRVVKMEAALADVLGVNVIFQNSEGEKGILRNCSAREGTRSLKKAQGQLSSCLQANEKLKDEVAELKRQLAEKEDLYGRYNSDLVEEHKKLIKALNQAQKRVHHDQTFPNTSEGNAEAKKTRFKNSGLQSSDCRSLVHSRSKKATENNSDRTKNHRKVSWTIDETMKLVDGVAKYGVGKWIEIKKHFFSSSSHRSSVDLKDKWRNLLKASLAEEQGDRQGKNKRDLPKSIMGRVCELAAMYPYPNKIGICSSDHEKTTPNGAAYDSDRCEKNEKMTKVGKKSSNKRKETEGSPV